MLSSPSRSSTDLDFFSPSKLSKSGASATSTVVVTTRLARRPVVTPHRTSSASPPSSSPYSSLSSSPAASSPIPKKRKSLPAGLSPGGSELPRDVKRLRTASSNQKPTKRKTKSSCQSSSRASSRPRTLPPSPEPIYRSSRSRSTSTFNLQEGGTAARKRRWCTDEDGVPGPNHLSSEMVVKRLMKSYKACEFSFLFPVTQ